MDSRVDRRSCEMNVWIRQRSAPFSASAARSMSPVVVRASAAITGPRTLDGDLRRPRRTRRRDEIGNPASRMSTFSRASCSAISTFSARVSAMPGACSPSRRVVSKIRTVLSVPVYVAFRSFGDHLRRRSPTRASSGAAPVPRSSSWDVRASLLSRRNSVKPPSASAIHSLANVPSWISSRIRRISRARLVVHDARTARVVAVLGRVGDRVTHPRQAALVDQVHDQLQLVQALEVRDLRLVAGRDERLEPVAWISEDARRTGRPARRRDRSRSPP